MSTDAHRKNARAGLDVGSLQCSGCGWHFAALDEATPADVVGLVANHLDHCPKRYLGHPAFALTPRWWTLQLYDGPNNTARTHIEFAWTSSGVGQPFDIQAAREAAVSC